MLPGKHEDDSLNVVFADYFTGGISAENSLQVFLAHNSWLNVHIWTNAVFDYHVSLADTEFMFCPGKDTFPLKAPSPSHTACRSLHIPFLAMPPSKESSWTLVTHNLLSIQQNSQIKVSVRQKSANALQVGRGAALRSQLDPASSALKVTDSVSVTS